MAKIYIAGPMSGYENFNFPAFNTAAYVLRRKGWTVLIQQRRRVRLFPKRVWSQVMLLSPLLKALTFVKSICGISTR